jgi:hypothetical protein
MVVTRPIRYTKKIRQVVREDK